MFWGCVPLLDEVSIEGKVDDELIFNWDETHPILRHVPVESMNVFEWLRVKLPVGKARYGIMLREDGMVYDDGTTSRLGENHFFMTTTTANAAGVLALLEAAGVDDALQRDDVIGLRAFLALGLGEFDLLPVDQRAMSLANDRAEVDEQVFAVRALDEAVALAAIEPLHRPGLSL